MLRLIFICEIRAFIFTAIFDKEHAAAIFGLLVANELAPGRAPLLRFDNQGALSTLRRGSAQTVLGMRMASIFWDSAAGMWFDVWIGSVRSGADADDPPSRMCKFAELPKNHITDYWMPVAYISLFSGETSILQPRYSFTPTLGGFGEPHPRAIFHLGGRVSFFSLPTRRNPRS